MKFSQAMMMMIQNTWTKHGTTQKFHRCVKKAQLSPSKSAQAGSFVKNASRSQQLNKTNKQSFIK